MCLLAHGRWQHSLRMVTTHRPTEVAKITEQILSWIKTTQMLDSYMELTPLHQFIPVKKLTVVPD